MDPSPLTAIDVHVHVESDSRGRLPKEFAQASAKYFLAGDRGDPGDRPLLPRAVRVPGLDHAAGTGADGTQAAAQPRKAGGLAFGRKGT